MGQRFPAVFCWWITSSLRNPDRYESFREIDEPFTRTYAFLWLSVANAGRVPLSGVLLAATMKCGMHVMARLLGASRDTVGSQSTLEFRISVCPVRVCHEREHTPMSKAQVDSGGNKRTNSTWVPCPRILIALVSWSRYESSVQTLEITHQRCVYLTATLENVQLIPYFCYLSSRLLSATELDSKLKSHQYL